MLVKGSLTVIVVPVEYQNGRISRHSVLGSMLCLSRYQVLKAVAVIVSSIFVCRSTSFKSEGFNFSLVLRKDVLFT